MRVVVVIALVGSTLAVGSTVLAHDSLAPPNAGHNWLPKEDWSAYHWSPFDEMRLARFLGISHRELYDYQSDDHKTLVELAVARGVNPVRLREALLAPWKGHVSPGPWSRRWGWSSR